MKIIIQCLIVSIIAIFFHTKTSNAQAPNLGTAANFVLFSTNGEVSNSGISQLTGNVGAQTGAVSGFGNVNGVMHSGDGASLQCAGDLLLAYNQLNAAIPDSSLAPLLGNGDTLLAGVYEIPSSATLNLDLYLDAKGNENSVFIFQIQAAFSTGAAAKVKLINGAKACNVFWNVEGLVSLASGTTMRGNIITNNAAIEMNSGDTLEGRALSTGGAVTVDGVLAYTPIGCGSPTLNGPTAPVLASTACYAIFSASGAVSNDGVSYATGDIGTNVGLTDGYNPLNVIGEIHPIPDNSTASCATDLTIVYTYLNTLPFDIELLYPAQFGRNLVLTPHTYLLNAATTLTDTLYLNALGNESAVFVIQINGFLSTSTYSKVILINGAQANNVYWKVDGAVSINDYSQCVGTIICNNGAINVELGTVLTGRVLTTTGAVSTSAMTVNGTEIPANCSSSIGITTTEQNSSNQSASVYPNPFSSAATIMCPNVSSSNPNTLKLYTILGVEVRSEIITQKETTINPLPAGIYVYKLFKNNAVIQIGKLISQQ